MFRKSIELAAGFTKPVVVSVRNVAGECGTIIGTYVVVSREGHFLTAWHIIAKLQDLQKQGEACEGYREARRKIEADNALSPKEKKRRVGRLSGPGKTAVRNFSPWWGRDDLRVEWAKGLPIADLAVGKFASFDPSWVPAYPKFKRPTFPLPIGVSLCKLGYPFHTLPTQYNEEKDAFELEPALHHFPIEGIITRHIEVAHEDPSQNFPHRVIETSSPGLMGQSGGPTFDVEGAIWAIQSRTVNLPLGFDPEVPGAKGRHEHQFLNAGWGVSVETIIPVLQKLGVPHELADY